ncbi:MAG: hypothetical protein EZS28_022059 [Streblomastix strix]|uniref:Uncharacterized protein n=1 Tax=Streblomastix strix TaxID=222440 RepID=A0A5J4VJH3_9EUKA|nr:MAG: hypothetical protein EZS28_022059 [Streblomastix strix]
MMENGTITEYFDGGYFIRDKKQIKCFEDGKKGLKLVTQAKQNKLMMQARGAPNQQQRQQKQKLFDSESSDDDIEEEQEQEQIKPQPVKKKVRVDFTSN